MPKFFKQYISIYLNTSQFFQNFLTILKTSYSKNFKTIYQHDSDCQITCEILKYGKESCHKNISQIRNVSFIFENTVKKIKTSKFSFGRDTHFEK